MSDNIETCIWRIERQLDMLAPDTPTPTRLPPEIMTQGLADANRSVAPLIGRGGRPIDMMISWEGALLLYYLARALRHVGELRLATRVFLVNKALHGIDLFPDIEMPAHFLIGHTVGMVFAKADYGEWCIFHQGCTVGRLLDARPTLANGVVMYPNSSIIGRCNVGPNTVLSAGVQLINTDTPGDCIVFAGESGRPVFKPITEIFAHRYYEAAATGLAK
jgi:serine O-acetyltransferase